MEDSRKVSCLDEVKMEEIDVNTFQESQDLEEINNVMIKVETETDWSEGPAPNTPVTHIENGRHIQWACYKQESKNFGIDELTTSTGNGISRWTVMSTTLTQFEESKESLQTVRIGLESEHPEVKPDICATNGGGLVDVFTGHHSGTHWSSKHEIRSDVDESPVFDDFPPSSLDSPVKSLDCGTSREEMSVLSSVTKPKTLYSDVKHYPCDVCGKDYYYASVLSKHGCSMHKTTRTCNICDKAKSTDNDLTVHSPTHTGEEPSIKCGVCNKNFPHQRVLSIHQEIYHNNDKTSIQNSKVGSDHAHLVQQKNVEDIGHIQVKCNKPDRKQFDSDNVIGKVCKISSKYDAEKGQLDSAALDINVPIMNDGKFQCTDQHTESKTFNGDAVRNNTGDGIMRWTVTSSNISPLVIIEETSKVKRLECESTTVVFGDESSTSPIQNQKITSNQNGITMNLFPCVQSEPLPLIEAMVCASAKSSEKTYKCDVCKMEFAMASIRNKHQRNHTGAKPYTCDVCNKKFAVLSSLSTHQRIHTGEMPFKCDVCNKELAVASKFSRHCRSHTGEKPYTCDVCNKEYADIHSLSRHCLIHTGEKLFTCDVCNKKFADAGGLSRHGRIHTGEKPYQCDVCNKEFTERGNLSEHQRIHTGVKPYKCNVCSKEFVQASNLSRHQRVHTGEKPYKCDVCNKEFAELGTLKKHRRVHTGEKPYKCDVCYKEFAELGTLKNHQRVHTGEKPYECDVCNKEFSRASYLKDHRRKHSGEKPYKCDVCHEEFPCASNLRNHRKSLQHR